MSEDRLVFDLKSYGLDDFEAKTYLTLLKMGSSRASVISTTLGINRTTTYRILERLKKLGIIESSTSRPVKFTAIEYEMALPMLIELKKDDVKAAEKKLSSVLEEFSKMYISPVAEPVSTKYGIFQGTDQVNRVVTRMARKAKTRIAMMTTSKDLGKLYHSSAYEALLEATTREVETKIVTEVDSNSLDLARKYEFAQLRHHPDSSLRVVVKDSDEAMLLVSSTPDDDIALWLSSAPFATTVLSIIDNEFYSALPLEAVSDVIKSGKLPESFRVIPNKKEFIDVLLAALANAQSDVKIGFSSSPLFSQPEVISVIRSIAARGVSVKVLSSANEIPGVKDLAESVKFKVTSFKSSMQIVIIDEKEMFLSKSAELETPFNLHTNVANMATFMNNILADIWRSGHDYVPEIVTLQKSMLPEIVVEMLTTGLQQRGINSTMEPVVKGRSGVVHKFDLVLKNPKTNTIVGIALVPYSDPIAGSSRLIELKIRALDCQPMIQIIVLFSPSGVLGQLSRAAQLLKLPIIEESNPEELVSAVISEIEKY